MYSRSVRKFLQPSHDHANPNLGPGCYTADETTLIAGKSLNETGFAPFSSLAPRVTYFEENATVGPAPGAYDPPAYLNSTSRHTTNRATLFGKSRAPRFRQPVSKTPGPGTYVVPGTVCKPGGGAVTGTGAGNGRVGEFGALHHAPVLVHGGQDQEGGEGVDDSAGQWKINSSMQKKGKSINSKVMDGGEQAAGSFDSMAASKNSICDNLNIVVLKPSKKKKSSPRKPKGSLSSKPGSSEGKELSGVAAAAEGASSRTQSGNIKDRKKINKTRKEWVDIANEYTDNDSQKPTIVWRRKFVPPSIPVGQSAFGYKESGNGELVPRKPPKRNLDPGPAYNFITSFVEKAKHENHGHRFAKESKGLKFKVTDSPGPVMYDLIRSERFLNARESTKGPAVMTLAPCTRMTDEIVAEAMKKGVPGPGAYDGKIDVQNPRPRGANVPGFGGSSNHYSPNNYIPLEQMYTPGPGAYYPEYANYVRHSALRPQPFGSTTPRFDTSCEFRSKMLPAPGSYDLDHVGKHFAQPSVAANSSRLRGFGSVGERFRYTIVTRASEPGPGQYDIADIPPVPTRPTTADRKKAAKAPRFGLGSQILEGPVNGVGAVDELDFGRSAGVMQPVRRVPPKKVVASVDVEDIDLSQVRIPAFGSQTDRFIAVHKDLPPPGAYEIAHAFNTLTTKGRVEKKSFMASQMKRELFKIQTNIPGPGEYEATPQDQRFHNNKGIRNGGFLSSMRRFDDKITNIPGPGAYLSPEHDSGLIKKSFNITLGDFENLIKAGVALHV